MSGRSAELVFAEQFLERAASIAGAAHVFAKAALDNRYGSNTLGETVASTGAVAPASVAEVQALVRLAGEVGASLYPVSTGNNWGYGAAAPPDERSVILDLSRMTAIDDTDIDLGVVRLEPGVTQQQLREWLNARGHGYMVPVHGGGPKCSIVGNLLERGYGITPVTDHFAALMAIEAVMPNGELYRTPLSEQGAKTDSLFKWGVGPYLDGLFSQGNLGVVVAAKVALAPLPARLESFVFRVSREEDLPRAVEAMRAILRSLPGVVHAINLMNGRRVLSMMADYPHTARGPDGVVADDHMARLAAKHRVTPWTGFGALYGEPGVVRAARQVIKAKLRGLARPLFIPASLVERATGVMDRVPAAMGGGVRAYLRTLGKSLQVLQGAPAEIALPLVYWKQGGIGDRVGLDPARDRRGILWYAPLIPLRASEAVEYVAMAGRVCRSFGMEPLLTLTTISERCIDSTVPLLFDPADADETARAMACYEALLEEGRQRGFMPYRYPIHQLSALVEPSQPYWQLVRRIKHAVDPEALIAPGRYS